METKLIHKTFKTLCPKQRMCLRVLDEVVIASSRRMQYNPLEGSHTLLLFPKNALTVRSCFSYFCSFFYAVFSKILGQNSKCFIFHLIRIF